MKEILLERIKELEERVQQMKGRLKPLQYKLLIDTLELNRRLLKEFDEADKGRVGESKRML